MKIDLSNPQYAVKLKELGVKQYGMFGEQLDAKKKLHTLTFYTED